MIELESFRNVETGPKNMSNQFTSTRYILLTYLRQDWYIEHGMIRGWFHSGMNDHGTIFKGDILSSMASFIRSLFWVVHLIEPVGTGGEATAVKDHANGKIRIVDVVIERHTPHHYQTRVQMLNLPADCSTRSCGCSRLQKRQKQMSSFK